MTGTVVLEALAQCGTAAFDKTGTLTTGQLAATSMRRPDTAAAANGAAPQHSHNGMQDAQSCVFVHANTESNLMQSLQCKAFQAEVPRSWPPSCCHYLQAIVSTVLQRVHHLHQGLTSLLGKGLSWYGEAAALRRVAAAQGIGHRRCTTAAAKTTSRRWSLQLHCPRGPTTLSREH